MKVQKLTSAALVAAFIFVVTYIVKIPMPISSGGYINLGDTIIYLGGLLLGGWRGAAAAAVGSALSDVLLGYFIYAPATFVIKGLMGLVCGLITRREGFAPFAVASSLAGVIMLAGYFLFETLFFNINQASASAFFNVAQLIAGVGVALALYPAAARIDRSFDLRETRRKNL
ncbi:MAG: ECF transporter S component [Clostridiales Family XIII bacterium]|jgi:uncharacterized membrane protein|nr:ECF transporter S component [Clostridiales Family XIII bacterium]